ncbi:sugar kinase [Neobacillus dielmonensis]|uniref:sugar kinase n=1 Tax=Neobacillus dielmonensis TaxID=1347369 RepID=UPI0005AA354A|nr:sugar kinase [Neobacillus dielmonensis]
MDVISIGETMVLFTPNTMGKMRYSNQYTTRIAGAETNTLIGLSRLGHQTGWISQLGNDEFGAQIVTAVRGEGVDTSQVTINENAPTGIFFKEIVNQDNVNIYYYRKNSAASQLSPDLLKQEYIANAKFLYLSGITPALSASCKETIYQAITIARKNGVKVVFDPNLRRKLWSEEEARETLLSIAGQSDIVLPGIGECEFLFESRDYKKAADSFHALGVETVIVKLGERGAYYSTNAGADKGHVEGFTVKTVVDPVGAGDGFAAGVLSGLLDGFPVAEAVKRGCAIGAMVCTVNGDIEGLPDRAELHQFFDVGARDEVKR